MSRPWWRPPPQAPSSVRYRPHPLTPPLPGFLAAAVVTELRLPPRTKPALQWHAAPAALSRVPDTASPCPRKNSIILRIRMKEKVPTTTVCPYSLSRFCRPRNGDRCRRGLSFILEVGFKWDRRPLLKFREGLLKVASTRCEVLLASDSLTEHRMPTN